MPYGRSSRSERRERLIVWLLLTALLAIPLSVPSLLAAPPDFASIFGGAVGQTVRDSTGNFYVAGWTNSPTIATTPGAFQTAFGPAVSGQLVSPPTSIPCYHGFVVKISPDGSKVLFATYLGGSSNDYIYSVAVDREGNVFVAGNTNSADFPVTAGSYSQTPSRAFVTSGRKTDSGFDVPPRNRRSGVGAP